MNKDALKVGGVVGAGCTGMILVAAIQLTVYGALIYGLVRLVKWAWGS